MDDQPVMRDARFVGGPRNGEVRPVPEGTREIRVRVGNQVRYYRRARGFGRELYEEIVNGQVIVRGHCFLGYEFRYAGRRALRRQSGEP